MNNLQSEKVIWLLKGIVMFLFLIVILMAVELDEEAGWFIGFISLCVFSIINYKVDMFNINKGDKNE